MLSALRAQDLLRGQPTQVQKVYESVPVQHPWEIARIRRDLDDRGVRFDIEKTAHCLGRLVDVGLVQESSRGSFRRVEIKPAPAPAAVKPENKPMPTAAPVGAHAPSSSPIDTLSAIAIRLRGAMDAIGSIAEDLDEAALLLEQQFAGRDDELAQARQLTALIKQIGGK